MKQYNSIKDNHKDSILFFRLGDFYEMFYDDAKLCSKLLGIALTSRNKKENIPMAGIPAHSASSYIAKLIDLGYKVAICEQQGSIPDRGIVNREVVKIVTPGTFTDTDFIDSRSNKYILSFCSGLKGSAISYSDFTTGYFGTIEFKRSEDAIQNIFKIQPSEIVLGIIKDQNIRDTIIKYSKIKKIPINYIDNIEDPERFLKEFFKIQSLASFGIESMKYSIFASAILLEYIVSLQNCNSIKKISYINTNNMHIDRNSIEHLDILDSNSSLLSILDNTKSALGARFLKRTLCSPLKDIEMIENRYNDIERYINNPMIRDELSNILKDVLDFERAYNRVLRSEANIRDMNVIKRSLNAIYKIYCVDNSLLNFSEAKLIELANLLNQSILDTNLTTITDGNIINPLYNKSLKELIDFVDNIKDYLINLENEEKIKTGIKNLKIGYNKVFGYYIEVTKSNLNQVPQHYIRKQTIANGERYIIESLKIYEEKMLTARDEICKLELQIFNEISSKLKEESRLFEILSSDISYLDFIISMSEIAIKKRYVRPILTKDRIVLKNSRHPIVESLVNDFIDNDFSMLDNQIIILTGPNMAGKSTFMKQVALSCIMAQIGSFIPASYAELPILDKIFTRVGASDDIITGQSTFMVEMNEMANILNNATDRSLIILDEVGRGTSTYDGIAIAQASIEYINKNVRAKTIFATHYHELNSMARKYDNISNYRVEVKEGKDRITFLNKIVKGEADKSYGIEVARLAGLPKELLTRSKELLSEMNSNENSRDQFDENIFEYIASEISNLDIDNMSPNQLYTFLADIKSKLRFK
jgi:DNA mismatch repair protein MutS